jgi:hypothetical protein
MEQGASIEFLAKAHSIAAEKQGEIELTEERLRMLLRRFGVKPDQIAKRGLESYEMSSEVRSILERTVFFGNKSSDTLKRFYNESSTAPAHLIHVTCTGYTSPSPAQHLVNFKNWQNSTKVTHAYHMGCYASIPAIRMALGFVKSGDPVVDLVHTELCSLHLNPAIHTPEQLVVQTLFADGYIRYSAQPSESVTEGFKVLGILEHILPNSEEDMTWITADWGMHMTLSREVPRKIGGALKGFVQSLAQSVDLDLNELMKNATFAIHPGGPKIIDSVQETLGLEEWQVTESKKILLQYGNMSSATLPHVWSEILKTAKHGQKIVSMAFGPGLTLFGIVFEVIRENRT